MHQQNRTKTRHSVQQGSGIDIIQFVWVFSAEPCAARQAADARYKGVCENVVVVALSNFFGAMLANL